MVWRIENYHRRRYVSPMARFEAVVTVARTRSGNIRPTSEEFKRSELIVNDFCNRVEAQDISITPHIGQIALQVAQRYRKFVGHEANLNFGDCFSYACAKAKNTCIVYKGNDFSKTDLA